MSIDGGCLGCDNVAELAPTAELATIAAVIDAGGARPLAGVGADPDAFDPARLLFGVSRPGLSFQVPALFPDVEEMFD